MRVGANARDSHLSLAGGANGYDGSPVITYLSLREFDCFNGVAAPKGACRPNFCAILRNPQQTGNFRLALDHNRLQTGSFEAYTPFRTCCTHGKGPGYG
jgi:hypothetical protein